MRKTFIIIISCLFLSQGVQAELESKSEKSNAPKVFLGLEYFQGDSTLESDLSGAISASLEEDFDLSGFKIKMGKEFKEALRFQAYIAIEDAEDGFENQILILGADVIKRFPINSKISPFLLAGAFAGSTELEDSPGIEYVDDQLHMLGLKIGLGGIFHVNQSFEVVLGADFNYRKWQEIKYIGGGSSVTLEQNDQSNVWYAGFNYHF